MPIEASDKFPVPEDIPPVITKALEEIRKIKLPTSIVGKISQAMRAKEKRHVIWSAMLTFRGDYSETIDSAVADHLPRAEAVMRAEERFEKKATDSHLSIDKFLQLESGFIYDASQLGGVADIIMLTAIDIYLDAHPEFITTNKEMLREFGQWQGSNEQVKNEYGKDRSINVDRRTAVWCLLYALGTDRTNERLQDKLFTEKVPDPLPRKFFGPNGIPRLEDRGNPAQ